MGSFPFFNPLWPFLKIFFLPNSRKKTPPKFLKPFLIPLINWFFPWEFDWFNSPLFKRRHNSFFPWGNPKKFPIFWPLTPSPNSKAQGEFLP